MDLSDLKDILRTLEEQDITEFELEQEGVKLRVCRASRQAGAAASAPASSLLAGTAGPTAAPASSGQSGPPAAASAAVAAEGAGADRHTEVRSPIVGTFYRTPDPNSPPFVSVGDTVRVGQVLCIIEAMKLMNEIEAEVAGEVVKVHPENGQPVQYGDALFTIRPA